MKKKIIGLTTRSEMAADDRTASISGLTMGVYLVTATGGTAVYRPTVAMITPEESNGSWTITENARVVLKSSPVSLKKTITAVNGSAGTTAVSSDGKRAVAGIGDTVSYKLEVDVPEYPSQSVSRIFTIADTDFDGIPDSKEQPTTDTTTTQTTEKDNGLVSITVENTKGFTLPRTGGIGTVLFSMIGIVLMGSGVLLVAVFLRKRFGKSR